MKSIRKMKQHFFVLSLLISSGANAELIKLSDTSYRSVYIDSKSISKSGPYTRTIALLNEYEPVHIDGNDYYNSLKLEVLFDCGYNLVMIRKTSLYSGANATGKLLGSGVDDNADFGRIKKQSWAQAAYSFACSQKP